MIEVMPESGGKVLAMAVDGKLTDADYRDVIIPQLEKRLEQHNVLRLLMLTKESFSGWDFGAAWDDLKLGLEHRSDFEKIAIVGASGWLDWAARVAAWLLKGETRFYKREQIDEAWRWVRA